MTGCQPADAHSLFSFSGVARRFVGWLGLLTDCPDLVLALGHLALTLLIAGFLCRRHIFFKV